MRLFVGYDLFNAFGIYIEPNVIKIILAMNAAECLYALGWLGYWYQCLKAEAFYNVAAPFVICDHHPCFWVFCCNFHRKWPTVISVSPEYKYSVIHLLFIYEDNIYGLIIA